ncbi:benzoate-CoA ligase family protein [bacterium]|nr:benzoate-CoA ligase family protein [bacterium]
MSAEHFSGFDAPEHFNLAEFLLDARLQEGNGGRRAIVTDSKTYNYQQVFEFANQFGNVLRQMGAEQEDRVIISLPDIPEYPCALFGILKIGAVVVMVNPQLKSEDIAYFLEYTRAKYAIVFGESYPAFAEASSLVRHHLKGLLAIGELPQGDCPVPVSSFDSLRQQVSTQIENSVTHRDDAAIWLFSGGTTGKPKAVVQTHQSFANTTECYAKKHLEYDATDLTISVPKLFFGYATGSNLFFPFSVGAACVLFPERCTAEVLFEKIRKHRPTILINVPTMVNQMVGHPEAMQQDFRSLRFATSAGEALPVELYDRWKRIFGVELLDGLGTAEMWHIFISNRVGLVKPGTVGTVVPGFEVKSADDQGKEVPEGEVGMCWVRGKSRAIGYWQLMEKTASSFRGEWYITGDLVRKDADGFYTHCGRGDDMMKVSGKWVSPQEVENCLLKHAGVRECAVVPITDAAGLTKPCAYVIAAEQRTGFEEELKEFVKKNLEPYKYPRHIIFVESLPRTHLGKVDRGELKKRMAGRDTRPTEN